MKGPWRTVEDVELATLGWVHWWNKARLLEPIGNVPPLEFEQTWLAAQPVGETHTDVAFSGVVS